MTPGPEWQDAQSPLQDEPTFPAWLPKWVPWLAEQVEVYDEAAAGTLANPQGEWRVAFVDLSSFLNKGARRSYAEAFCLGKTVYILDGTAVFRSQKGFASLTADLADLGTDSSADGDAERAPHRGIFPACAGSLFDRDLPFFEISLPADCVHTAPKTAQGACIRTAAAVGAYEPMKHPITIPFIDAVEQQDGFIAFCKGPDAAWRWRYAYSSTPDEMRDLSEAEAETRHAVQDEEVQGRFRPQRTLQAYLYGTTPAWHSQMLPRTKQDMRVAASQKSSPPEPLRPPPLPGCGTPARLFGGAAPSPANRTEVSFAGTDVDTDWSLKGFCALRVGGRISFCPSYAKQSLFVPERLFGGGGCPAGPADAKSLSEELVIISPWGSAKSGTFQPEERTEESSPVRLARGRAVVVSPDVDLRDWSAKMPFADCHRSAVEVEARSSHGDSATPLTGLPAHWILGPPRVKPQKFQVIQTTPAPLIRDAHAEEVNATLCAVEGSTASEWLLVMLRPNKLEGITRTLHSWVECKRYYASITDRYQMGDPRVADLCRFYSDAEYLSVRKQNCTCPLRFQKSDFSWREREGGDGGYWQDFTVPEIKRMVHRSSLDMWEKLARDVTLPTLNASIRAVMLTGDHASGGALWDPNAASGQYLHQGCFHSLTHDKQAREKDSRGSGADDMPCAVCGVRGAVLCCTDPRCGRTAHLFCALLSRELQRKAWAVDPVRLNDDDSDMGNVGSTFAIRCPAHIGSEAPQGKLTGTKQPDAHMLQARLLSLARSGYEDGTDQQGWAAANLRVTETDVHDLLFKVEACRPRGGLTRRSGDKVPIACSIFYDNWAGDSGFSTRIDLESDLFSDARSASVNPLLEHPGMVGASELEVISGDMESLDAINDHIAVGPIFSLGDVVGKLTRSLQVKLHAPSRPSWGAAYVNITILRQFRPMGVPLHFFSPSDLVNAVAGAGGSAPPGAPTGQKVKARRSDFVARFCNAFCEPLEPVSEALRSDDSYDSIKLFCGLSDHHRKLNLAYRYAYWRIACMMRGLPTAGGYFQKKRDCESEPGAIVCLYGIGVLRHLLWEVSTLPVFRDYYTYVIDASRVPEVTSLVSRILLDAFGVEEGAERKIASLLGIQPPGGNPQALPVSLQVLLHLITQLRPAGARGGAPTFRSLHVCGVEQLPACGGEGEAYAGFVEAPRSPRLALPPVPPPVLLGGASPSARDVLMLGQTPPPLTPQQQRHPPQQKRYDAILPPALLSQIGQHSPEESEVEEAEAAAFGAAGCAADPPPAAAAAEGGAGCPLTRRWASQCPARLARQSERWGRMCGDLASASAAGAGGGGGGPEVPRGGGREARQRDAVCEVTEGVGAAYLKQHWRRLGAEASASRAGRAQPAPAFKRVAVPNPPPYAVLRQTGEKGTKTDTRGISIEPAVPGKPFRIALFVHGMDKAPQALFTLVEQVSKIAPEALRVCATVQDLSLTRHRMGSASPVLRHREVEMSTFIDPPAVDALEGSPVPAGRRGKAKAKGGKNGKAIAAEVPVPADEELLRSFEQVLKSTATQMARGCLWVLAVLQMQSRDGVVPAGIFFKKAEMLNMSDPPKQLHHYIDHSLVIRIDDSEGERYRTALVSKEALNKLQQKLQAEVGKWYGKLLLPARLSEG